MFKHLLVTLDGSAKAECVVAHARDVAQSMSAEVTLLRIVDAVDSDWSERGALGKKAAGSVIHPVLFEQAESYLDRVGRQMRATGLKVHTLVKQGAAAKQIVAAAKEIDADAIAMATHSRGGVSRLMFGSVAEEVMHGSNLPILLVRAA
jgi:nucleotide-binding universal stress UspA family protein